MEEAQILVSLKNHYKIQFIKTIFPNVDDDTMKQLIFNKLYVVCLPYCVNGVVYCGMASSKNKEQMDKAFTEFFIYQGGIYLNKLI
jgi:hypothetical protein